MLLLARIRREKLDSGVGYREDEVGGLLVKVEGRELRSGGELMRGVRMNPRPFESSVRC